MICKILISLALDDSEESRQLDATFEDDQVKCPLDASFACVNESFFIF